MVVRSVFPVLTNKEYYEKVILPPIENKQVKDADVLINLLTAFLSNSDDVVKEFYNCIDCEDSIDIENINTPLDYNKNDTITEEESLDRKDIENIFSDEISLRRRYYI